MAVSAGTAGGVTPTKVVFQAVSVVQAMPWRLNAAPRAAPWGVPSFRLPLSSSTARIERQSVPVEQPFADQVPLAVQTMALVAVERDRYQRRSVVAQAEPLPGLGRSRLAKSHRACDGTSDCSVPLCRRVPCSWCWWGRGSG